MDDGVLSLGVGAFGGSSSFFPPSTSDPRPLVSGSSFWGCLGGIDGIGGICGVGGLGFLRPRHRVSCFLKADLRYGQPVYNSCCAAVYPLLPPSFADHGSIDWPGWPGSLPIKTQLERVVSMGCPGSYTKLDNLFYSAKVRGHHFFWEINWHIAQCYTNSPGAHVLRLEPEELCVDAVFGQLSSLVFC